MSRYDPSYIQVLNWLSVIYDTLVVDRVISQADLLLWLMMLYNTLHAQSVSHHKLHVKTPENVPVWITKSPNAVPCALLLQPRHQHESQATALCVLESMFALQAADLEQALLVLPFTEALRLLSYLCQWLRKGLQVELCCRVSTLLVRLHHPQLVATPSARPALIQLQTLLRTRVQGLKDTMGFNLAALQHLKRSVKENQAGLTVSLDDSGSVQRPVKRLIRGSD